MPSPTHPYDQHSPLYNFFFHPLHFKQKEITTLSIITNIVLTIFTSGLFQIPFWIINRLDNRKLEIWRKEQAPRVYAAASSVFNRPYPSFNSPIFNRAPPSFNSPTFNRPSPSFSPQPEPLSSKVDLEQACTFLAQYRCPQGWAMSHERQVAEQANEYAYQLQTHINRTFKEKLVNQGKAWNGLQVFSRFDKQSKTWTISLLGNTDAKLKSNYSFRHFRKTAAGYMSEDLMRSGKHDQDFLAISFEKQFSSLTSLNDELFEQFSQALDLGNKYRSALEAIVFDKTGQCCIVPSQAVDSYQVYLKSPEIKVQADNKMEASLTLGMDVTVNKRQYSLSSLTFNNSHFDLLTEALLRDTQLYFRNKFDEEMRGPTGSSFQGFNFSNFFNIGEELKLKQKKSPETTANINRLDELLDLNGALKEAYRLDKKEKALELLADGKMRRAAFKFHPDKVENKEEGEQLFKEFRDLVEKAKKYFSSL